MEFWDKLPVFIQLCVGLGTTLAVFYAGVQAVKKRKFFYTQQNDAPIFNPQLSEPRRLIYEHIEECGRRIDQRVDENKEDINQRINELAARMIHEDGDLENRLKDLEGRVRSSEQEIAVLKSRLRSVRK